MIYIIGGAGRAGKTLLTRRLLAEHRVPCFCLDYLVTALERGAPELGIAGESPNRFRAEKLWPRVEFLFRNIIEVEPAYTVEGDAIWPRGIAALMTDYPGQIRAVFLGYANSTPDRKLAEIRRFGGGVNDWLQDYPDDYVLDLAREMIGFSVLVGEECRRLGLPYCDVSDNFTAVLEDAYRRLVGAGGE